MTHDALSAPEKPGAVRRLAMWWGGHGLLQILAIGAVVALLALLFANVSATMARVGITPGFAFLGRSANFEIGESLIGFRGGDPYALAILAGFLNTVKVALAGCVLATILGVVVGVAGLSGNLLLGGLVRSYVEVVRNTPLLLQLFFWISLAQAFPAPRQAISAFDAIFLTNRGVYVPSLSVPGLSGWSVAAGLAAIALFLLLLRLAKRRLALPRAASLSLAGLALLALAGVAIADGVAVEIPVLSGFNIRGGHVLTPEFAALLTGLVVKFSAAIAEIVRAGIQSVTTGQWEAARAVGLRDGQIMRLVVLPQALKVITPLTTSSYLDLAKDSSLAVAIGYPDVVSVVNTTANTTGQSLEALAIMMGAYLVINLSISALMNLYNRRIAMRGAARA